MPTYYVNTTAVGASDANVGSSSAPFATLGHANTIVTSGDTVFVSPGTYREQVTCKTNSIIWQATGPGVYVRATVAIVGTWSSTATNAWSVSYTTTTSPVIVLVDDVPFTAATSSTTTTANQFFYDSAGSILYIDMGGPSPSGHAIEAGKLSSCFSLSNITGCTVEGFKLWGSNGYGILMQGGGGHIFRSNNVLGHASGGIKLTAISPQLFSPADNGPGGTLTAGKYGYLVTAIIGGNESLPSSEQTITIAANHTVQVQWSKVPTASSFNVYGRTTGGETLITNIANSFGAGFPTWVDDGSLTPDGSTSAPVSSNVAITPCTIEGNEVWRNMSHGVYMYAAAGCAIRGNHCHHNVFHGIAILNGSNNNTVEFNVCHQNSKGNRSANGIQVSNFGSGSSGSTGNIIQYNRCFRNEDSGMSIYNGSSGCIVRRNICYLNGDHGIDNLDAPNTHMSNNLCYGNVSAGLNSEGTSQGIRMYNNISMDNGVQSPRSTGNYRVDQTANADAQCDYNLSYLTVPAALQPGGSGIANAEITWGTTKYNTLANFTSAVSGQMTHGISSDPRFVDLSNSDFHLLSSSPGVHLGSSSAPDFASNDFYGNTSGVSPNAGPIE